MTWPAWWNIFTSCFERVAWWRALAIPVCLAVRNLSPLAVNIRSWAILTVLRWWLASFLSSSSSSPSSRHCRPNNNFGNIYTLSGILCIVRFSLISSPPGLRWDSMSPRICSATCTMLKNVSWSWCSNEGMSLSIIGFVIYHFWNRNVLEFGGNQYSARLSSRLAMKNYDFLYAFEAVC